MADQLFVNDERLGSISYVGTWEEWRRGMEPCFRTWYQEWLDKQEDGEKACTYEEWVESTMEESLSEATEEEIKKYERLID